VVATSWWLASSTQTRWTRVVEEEIETIVGRRERESEKLSFFKLNKHINDGYIYNRYYSVNYDDGHIRAIVVSRFFQN